MLAVGDQIERYTVVDEIGKGGMGVVYRVSHSTLGVDMALKVLHASANDATRLIEEGRLQARLRHPGIVSVADLLDIEGRPGLVMELVEGRPLDQWLREERPDFARIQLVFARLVAAVAYAHGHGVVHRDLKPGNVLVELADESPRVTDFGIAALVADSEGPAEGTAGSPAYMAPEQFRRNAGVDVRADLWSLGVVLYELCCDQRPFVGDDLQQLQQAMTSGNYRRPGQVRPDLPQGIQAAIEACLQPDPAARPESCAALLLLLEHGEAPAEGFSETWEATTYEEDAPEPLAERPASALVSQTRSELVWHTVRKVAPSHALAPAMLASINLLKLFFGASLMSVLPWSVALFLGMWAVLVGQTTAMTVYSQTKVVREQAPVVPGSLRDRWRQLPRGPRMFVGMGLPFGGIMGVLTGVMLALDGASLGVALGAFAAAGLFSGVFFGGFMTLFGGFFQVLGHSDGGKRISTQMSCEQHQTALVNAAPEVAYVEAERAVATLGVARVLVADPDTLQLAVVTTMKGNEAPSVVDVRVQVEDGMTVAHVSSRPTMSTALIDGGSNKRNVAAVVDALIDAFPAAE